MSAPRRRRGIVAAFLLLLAGCEAELDAPAAVQGELDEAFFRCKVQPVLVRSCGAFACHGDTKRFFRVFGRNRLRYASKPTFPGPPLTAEEQRFNLEAAAAFVDREQPEKSLLLTKPLDQAAGGAYHGGATLYGQGDVFERADDPDYLVLVDWVHGKKEDASCVEPGS